MTCVSNKQTNGPCPSWTFSASTNRITIANFTYDAAGDLTKDGNGPGTHTYQWDAENRLKSVDSGTTASYTYNALGQRVEKLVGSAYTETVYDRSGESLGENNRTTWTQSFVPFNGRHVAHYQNGATYFTHGNSLGSTAQATDYSGSVAQDQLFYPWGQTWTMAGTTQETRFASLRHRDSETGADPTLYRMFSSTQGRWFSPDPVPGTTSDPQTFDLYSYVANNPTNRTDPRGNCYGDVTIILDGLYWVGLGRLFDLRAHGALRGRGLLRPVLWLRVLRPVFWLRLWVWLWLLRSGHMSAWAAFSVRLEPVLELLWRRSGFCNILDRCLRLRHKIVCWSPEPCHLPGRYCGNLWAPCCIGGGLHLPGLALCAGHGSAVEAAAAGVDPLSGGASICTRPPQGHLRCRVSSDRGEDVDS